MRELFYQPDAEAYVQESLDFGYDVTLSGTYNDNVFDVEMIENWGDPLYTVNNPNLEDLVGTNPQPTENPYVRPTTP